jgi:hypothetical protein
MKYAREGHSCAVLGNNLFLIGGDGAPKSVEIYNMVEETWNHEAAGLTLMLCPMAMPWFMMATCM